MPKQMRKQKKTYSQRTIQGFAIIFTFTLLAAVFSYFFRVLLAKNLSLADFGLFFAILAFGGILSLIRDLGLSHAIYYFIPRFLVERNASKLKGIVSRVLASEVLMGIAMAGLTIFFADFLVEKYFRGGTVAILALFAAGFILQSVEQTIQHLFNTFHSQLLFSLHYFSRAFLLFIAAFLGFKYFGTGLAVPFLSQILAYAILLVFFASYFFSKTFPSFGKVEATHMPFKKLVSFGIIAGISLLGLLVLNYTDTLVLTYFRSLEEVGIYNGVLPIITLMLYLPLSISAVIFPMASELWAKKKKDVLKSIIEAISKYTFIILVPVAGLLVFYGEIALRLLFGEAFTQGKLALAILGFGAILYGLAQVYLQSLISIQGPTKNLGILVGAAAFNLAMNILLVPMYGIVGAAIATVASYALLFGLALAFLSRKIGFRLQFAQYSSILVSGALFMLAASYLKAAIQLPLLLTILAVIMIAGVVYIFLLFLFRVVNVREFIQLKENLLSGIRK